MALRKGGESRTQLPSLPFRPLQGIQPHIHRACVRSRADSTQARREAQPSSVSSSSTYEVVGVTTMGGSSQLPPGTAARFYAPGDPRHERRTPTTDRAYCISATSLSFRLQGITRTVGRDASRRPASHAVEQNGENRSRLRRIDPYGLGKNEVPKNPLDLPFVAFSPWRCSLPPSQPRASPELPLPRFSR